MCISGNRVNTLVYPREKRHLPLGRTSFLVDNAKVGHESPKFPDSLLFLLCEGRIFCFSPRGGNYNIVCHSASVFQVLLQSALCKQASNLGVNSANGLFLSSFFVSPGQNPYLCSVNLTRGGLCCSNDMKPSVRQPLSVLCVSVPLLSAFALRESCL